MDSKIILSFTILFSTSFILFNNIPLSDAQLESSTATSSEAVTSTNDAITKAVLIISQVAVAGLTFNELFLRFLKFRERKRGMKNDVISNYLHSSRFLGLPHFVPL